MKGFARAANQADRAAMVLVPAGVFVMGSDRTAVLDLWRRQGWDPRWMEAAVGGADWVGELHPHEVEVPPGIEVRGLAELHDEGGERFGPGWDSAWFRIVPRRIVSWGITGAPFSSEGRSARTPRGC